MRYLYGSLSVLAVLTLSAGELHAWNGHGHMAIAKIAYDQLTDGQKIKIAAILKEHPHYATFLVKGKPAAVPENEWAFVQASIWPDWIKGGNRGRKPDGTTYNIPEWHYINKPFIAVALVQAEDRDKLKEEKLPIPGKTILTGLKDAVDKLKAVDTSPAEKAVALCWLLHLVGDIHQPLHCASLYSSSFPKGDRGGNDHLVKTGGRTTRLHAFWDDLIGSSMRYYMIVSSADTLSRDPKFKREEFKTELARTAFSDWVDESFRLAKEFAYRNGTLKTQKLPREKDDKSEVPELPADYSVKAREVARKRAALAGWRLFDQVNALVK